MHLCPTVRLKSSRREVLSSLPGMDRGKKQNHARLHEESPLALFFVTIAGFIRQKIAAAKAPMSPYIRSISTRRI